MKEKILVFGGWALAAAVSLTALVAVAELSVDHDRRPVAVSE